MRSEALRQYAMGEETAPWTPGIYLFLEKMDINKEQMLRGTNTNNYKL